MNLRHLATGLAVALTCSAPLVHASDNTDALQRCVVAAVTHADRVAFARWMIVYSSLSPEVADLTAVTTAQRDAANKTMAEVSQRLLSHDCVAESRAAMKSDGRNAFTSSFGKFGEIAMQEMSVGAESAGGTAAMLKYMDLGALLGPKP